MFRLDEDRHDLYPMWVIGRTEDGPSETDDLSLPLGKPDDARRSVQPLLPEFVRAIARILVAFAEGDWVGLQRGETNGTIVAPARHRKFDHLNVAHSSPLS